jgi:Starch-binding associating with outer membrane
MKIQLNKIIYGVLIGCAMSFSSCKDYLDINTDPTRISEQQATLASLLPTIIEGSSQSHYNYAFTVSQITQHIASVGGGGASQHAEIRLAGAWSTTYLTAMSNAKILISKAEAAGAPHYAGMAKIILAYNLGLATSSWENIPFSQGFDIKNLKPGYDTQESIYKNINTLLDEAILDLDKTSTQTPSATVDIAYGGNRTRWKAAARALKARYALHFTAKGATTAADNALAALSTGAMASNADDLQLVYNTRNLNPWHTGVALANNTGNVTVRHGGQLIDAMSSVTYGVWDPRLRIIGGRLAANASATTWLGAEGGTGGGNVDFTASSWHSTSAAPIEFVTFAEQKFIQAEAEFLKNGGTATSKGTTAAGYQAYLDGIKASLDKIIGTQTDTGKTRYLADPKVAVGAANLTLQMIMAEKFKAMFLNPDFWSDMRRWDYSKDVFKDLELPRNQNVDLAGKWIERSFYPTDEFNRNGENARLNQKPLNARMWIFSK